MALGELHRWDEESQRTIGCWVYFIKWNGLLNKTQKAKNQYKKTTFFRKRQAAKMIIEHPSNVHYLISCRLFLPFSSIPRTLWHAAVEQQGRPTVFVCLIEGTWHRTQTASRNLKRFVCAVCGNYKKQTRMHTHTRERCPPCGVPLGAAVWRLSVVPPVGCISVEATAVLQFKIKKWNALDSTNFHHMARARPEADGSPTVCIYLFFLSARCDAGMARDALSCRHSCFLPACATFSSCCFRFHLSSGNWTNQKKHYNETIHEWKEQKTGNDKQELRWRFGELIGN